MLWTLDSCGPVQNCVIEVDNNFNFVRFVSKCPVHTNIPDTAAGFADIRNENSRGPGNTLDEILQNAPTSLYDLGDGGSRTFKKGINVTWGWSGSAPNRVLNINVTGFVPTQNQRDAIMAKLNARFGSGNVTVTYS